MTLSKCFEKLGAPLANVRWSWGAVRSDGTIILRVWQDRTQKRDGVRHVQLTHLEKYGDGRGRDKLGYSERLSHVAIIKTGAKTLLVMCSAEEPKASTRRIKSFNKSEVFIGGRAIEIDGDTWIEIIERVPVASVI